MVYLYFFWRDEPRGSQNLNAVRDSCNSFLRDNPPKIKLGGGGDLAVNSRVATLVFDIETSALPLEHF